jgi:hypothetical protein
MLRIIRGHINIICCHKATFLVLILAVHMETARPWRVKYRLINHYTPSLYMIMRTVTKAPGASRRPMWRRPMSAIIRGTKTLRVTARYSVFLKLLRGSGRWRGLKYSILWDSRHLILTTKKLLRCSAISFDVYWMFLKSQQVGPWRTVRHTYLPGLWPYSRIPYR